MKVRHPRQVEAAKSVAVQYRKRGRADQGRCQLQRTTGAEWLGLGRMQDLDAEPFTPEVLSELLAEITAGKDAPANPLSCQGEDKPLQKGPTANQRK